MFFTYLWRELRRRARQAIFIAVGLALGIGLVITVTAASAGVKNAQSSVLHSLYGVGTDITVTKAPTTSAAGNGGFGFSFRQNTGTNKRPAAGSKINNNTLTTDFTLSSISSTAVTTVSKLPNVAAAAGGLTLTDRTVTGTVPAFNTGGSGGGGGFGGGGGWRWRQRRRRRGLHRRRHVQLQHQQLHRERRRHHQRRARPAVHRQGQLRPHLHRGGLGQGRGAGRLELRDDQQAQGRRHDRGRQRQGRRPPTSPIVGIVTEPSGDNPADVYFPLGVAQSLANLKNDVNTIYVSATSGDQISSVASAIK